MPSRVNISRRTFLRSGCLFTGSLAVSSSLLARSLAPAIGSLPLQEFGYGDVSLASEPHNRQLEQTHAVLMELSEDSLLKPFRQMGGQPAPGADLGGWYIYDPNYNWHTSDAGFAPGATFGQWVSALARNFAITKDPKTRAKILRLNRLYAKTISAGYYEKNRFPAYCYDKLTCGLIDSHQFAGDPDAFAILAQTADTALPHLPGKAIEHGTVWRPGTDESFTWDESYTVPENQFLAYQRGAGERYRKLGIQYLDEAYFGPLSEGRNVLAGRHAYSYVNALSSAMQAYLTLGSQKHLRAAGNAFEMLSAQSFATGGWGPDETLQGPGSDGVFRSLSSTHNSFETPCGAYAHFKLTRYLLRVTRKSSYGDSMERVMYNTVLGAKPLQPDGKAFYYSDYNFKGHKVYSKHLWPCCSGTLPQIAADYGISAYFRDPRGVYVNLYLPSSLSWRHEGVNVTLTQKTGYPFDSLVRFAMKTSQPCEFSVRLRIPAWAGHASIAVNGKRITEPVIAGEFASIHRRWKTGDQIDLDLPAAKRLEAIDPQHPKTVALLWGPLVLFPIADTPPVVTRQQLLAAEKIGPQNWQVKTASGLVSMLPFTAISGQPYSTYLNVG